MNANTIGRPPAREQTAKVCATTICALLWSTVLSAAAVQEAWTRTYNGAGQRDQAVGMAVDSFGDVYITGFSMANDQFDFVTIKYAQDGTQIWAQRYEGLEDANDQPSAIAVDGNNQVFVTGKSVSTNGVSSWVILKYDTDGNLLWLNTVEGVIAPDSSPIGLVIDASGDCYIAGPKAFGETNEFTAAKFSAIGGPVWVQFGGLTPTAMTLDEAAGLIVTGSAAGAADSSDMVTAKIDASGSLLWTSRYDANGDDQPQFANDVSLDAGGNLYIAGARYSEQGWQFITLMYGPDGTLVWEASHSAPPGEGHEGHTVRVDSLGNVYVVGTANYVRSGSSASDTTTLKYNAAGAFLWAARHRSPFPASFLIKRALAIDPSESGVYIGDALDFTTVRYDSDGNLEWAVSRPSALANSFAVGPGSEIYRAGVTFGTDPPSPADSGDLITAKYTQTPNPSRPRVFLDPASHETIVGSNVTFSANASGPGPFRYQWRFNGGLITNATNAQLSLPAVPAAAAGDYSVIVSNATAYTVSTEARLLLHVPPTITSRAQTNTVLVGEGITLSVTAIGDAQLSYQWFFDGAAISGATNSTLELTQLLESASGHYTVEVRNPYGVAVSQPYQLTVTTGSLGLTLKGTWPGYARGPVFDVALAGNRAYVAVGSGGLVVFDVTNPARPVPLGSHPAANSVRKVHVHEGYAYVLEAERWTGSNYLALVQILDVADPANPILMAAFDTPSAANDIFVAETRAYVASSDSLLIFDISDREQPIPIGEYDPDESVTAITVSGNYGFIANSLGGLQIVDVSDPANVRRVGTYPTCDGRVRDVALHGNYAYVADSEQGLVILDIREPENPKRAGGNGRPLGPVELRVAGNRLYVLGSHWEVNRDVSELVVYDITIPDDPVRLSRTELQSYGVAFGLDATGNHAFVAAGDGGLQVFDTINPANPRLISGGITMGFARAVGVSGKRAYLADSFGGVQVIDVADPSAPNQLASYPTEGLALDIQMANGRTYVAESDGLLIADFTNPVNPTRLGRLSTSHDDGENSVVQIVGELAYVLDDLGDLQIINVANAATPFVVGSYAVTNGRAFGLHVAGTRAYLVGTMPVDEDRDTGFLLILDVTQPTSPTRVGLVNTSTHGNGVTLKGQFAFIAGQSVELLVLDVSNPANPIPVGQFDGPGAGENLEVIGNYAYVAGQSLGVLVLDVSNPAQPYRVAHYPFVNNEDEDVGCDIAVSGNLAYVTRGHHGLLIFEITGLPIINSVSRSGANVVISWNGSPRTKLQRADTPAATTWIDVPGTEGANQATISAGQSHQFFRLLKP